MLLSQIFLEEKKSKRSDRRKCHGEPRGRRSSAVSGARTNLERGRKCNCTTQNSVLTAGKFNCPVSFKVK